MILADLSLGAWVERYYAIREGWSNQTSLGAALLLVGLLSALLLILYAARALNQWWQVRQTYNPRGLFREILESLSLTRPNSRLLRRIGRELHLPHPTVILLSRGLFITYTNRWMSTTGQADFDTRQRLDELAAVLFGEEKGQRGKGAEGQREGR